MKVCVTRMIEWHTSENLIEFEYAETRMNERVEGILENKQSQLIWLLEHHPFYTAGTSANKNELLKADFLPVFQARRGGSYTYHGPGQRVIYLMLNLKNFGTDIRNFVWTLEEWIILTIKKFGVVGERRAGRVGVWVSCKNEENKKTFPKDKKIASIGLRVKKWITFYGVSINIKPDLSHFSGIVPCGNRGFGVTSLEDLGKKVSFEKVDEVLKEEFNKLFKL